MPHRAKYVYIYIYHIISQPHRAPNINNSTKMMNLPRVFLFNSNCTCYTFLFTFPFNLQLYIPIVPQYLTRHIPFIPLLPCVLCNSQYCKSLSSVDAILLLKSKVSIRNLISYGLALSHDLRYERKVTS